MTLRILRTRETFKIEHKGKLYEGRRCSFIAGPLTLDGLQRGNGYVALPAGLYIAKMDTYVSRSHPDGPVRQCFRFLERTAGDGELTPKQQLVLEKDSGLIHSATRPWHLEGCFSPGVARDEGGVMGSPEAMRILFEAFGGFEVGKPVRIKIEEV